jgi:flavodoxin
MINGMSSGPILAIYASTSGNTEVVVDEVVSRWRQAGLEMTVVRSETAPLDIWEQGQTFLLATSTWEHGIINPFFQPLFEKLAEVDCSGKQAAFIGMGDRRYEPVLFCQGIKELRKRWSEQGGASIGQPLLINGEPYDLLDTQVASWADQTLALLRGEQPVAANPGPVAA